MKQSKSLSTANLFLSCTFSMILLGFMTPAGAAVYKCTDTYGDVIYQNEPCKGAGRKLPSADDTLSTVPPDTSSAPVASAPPAETLGDPFGQPLPDRPDAAGGAGGLGGLTAEQRAELQKKLPAGVSLEEVDKLMSMIQGGNTEELEAWLQHMLLLLTYAMLALVVLSLPVGLLAKRWKRSFWGWFVLSLTISPILAILILLVRGKAPVPPDPE